MDTTKTVTHISLCAGYGGIDLGLKRAIPHLRTIAFSEIEAFACANLVAKMEAGFLDAAPIWTDVKTFPWPRFHGKVDILSGGYPCQPFSAAGKRLGKDDPRHLWPWIADGIRLCRPSVCFFENVEGHISLGLREVLGELEEIGYRATWGVFSAAEVGATHQRKRLFILAYHQSVGIQGCGASWLKESQSHARERVSLRGGDCWPSRPGHPQFGWEPPRVVADASQQHGTGGSAWTGRGEWSQCDLENHRDGGNGDGQTEPALGRDPNGPASGMDYAELCVTCDNRTDELRLLGNGVVPATAERAFRVLSARFTA